MKNVIGIINLYEKNKRLTGLTNHRPIAAIPFLGRYRVIDFIISNMSNSGIKNVGVFIQEKPRPLTEHLETGKWWELDGKKDGLFIFYPYYNSVNSLYTTEIKTFKENIDFISNSEGEYVVIASSYMICNVDFNEAVESHKKSGSDITIMYKHVDNARQDFLDCDVIDMDEHGRMTRLSTNKGEKEDRDISMEVYIMNKSVLLKLIEDAANLSALYSLREIIAYVCNDLYIDTFRYDGYLICINDLMSYYRHSMELLDLNTRKQLFKEDSPIYTVVKDNPPARYSKEAVVKNSLVANGAIIEGTVENSIIARGVKIGKGAVIKNSILMSRCEVSDNAHLDSVVADKNTKFLKIKDVYGSTSQPIVFEKNSIV